MALCGMISDLAQLSCIVVGLCQEHGVCKTSMLSGCGVSLLADLGLRKVSPEVCMQSRGPGDFTCK